MASKALPRPGLLAHRESLNLKFPDLVARLTEAIGRKLTAYVAGVKDVRAVERWVTGSQPYGDVESRLRLTFQVVRTLLHYYADEDHEPQHVYLGAAQALRRDLSSAQ